ncbi:hypothetical protein [Candidatus Protochlamydia phocaeensis]|uniref:hypothetical protein n=1 Tax=Candidatus Protochlamydia phocaeensis TaxID=1414722 RepID=UPI0009AD4F13|nr:hypothetical protein [Candidatus Protochlamydia phocaeensis]
MATQRQIEANRQNAKHSTGPITEEGKTIVSQNAVKHGVFSKQILLESESDVEFESLKAEFYQQFQPQGFLEKLFWERTLVAAWRLSRITQLESMLMNYAVKKSYLGKGLIEVLDGRRGDELTLLSRYETSLERVLFRSLSELKALQSARKIGFVSQKDNEEVKELIKEN